MCITTEGQIWIRPEQERKIHTRVECASVHSTTRRAGTGLVLVKNNTTALGPKEVSIQPTAPTPAQRHGPETKMCGKEDFISTAGGDGEGTVIQVSTTREPGGEMPTHLMEDGVAIRGTQCSEKETN